MIATLLVLLAAGFSWHGRAEALEIRNVNGTIRAEASSGSEVEVTATKRAKHSDPESVKVVVVSQKDGVLICAVWPTPDGADEENRCGGQMSVHDNDVRVDFVVKVPSGTRFDANSVNGSVSAEGLAGDVWAKTVNGDVHVSTQGTAEAKTVNGNIEARIGRSDWREGLSFETVNGNITLELPAGLNAEVRAKTMNGRIASDFDVNGQLDKHHLKGEIGRGGGKLRLATLNGAIELRRAR